MSPGRGPSPARRGCDPGGGTPGVGRLGPFLGSWGNGSPADSGSASPGSNPGDPARSLRLVAQDTTLSRWRHGFESRRDHGNYQEKRSAQPFVPRSWSAEWSAALGHRSGRVSAGGTHALARQRLRPRTPTPLAGADRRADHPPLPDRILRGQSSNEEGTAPLGEGVTAAGGPEAGAQARPSVAHRSGYHGRLACL